jgi:hypothetical protein
MVSIISAVDRPVAWADFNALREVEDVSMIPGSTQFTRTPEGA